MPEDPDDDIIGGDDPFASLSGMRGEGDPEGLFDEGGSEPGTPAPAPAPASPSPAAATPPAPTVVTPPIPSAAPTPAPVMPNVVLPQATAQPVVPAPVTPAPALQAPATTPAPTPAPAPSAAAQPAPAAQPQISEADALAQWKTWRAESIKTLAQTSFALTDEQKQALEVDPGSIMPTLASTVYMMAIENTMAAVAEMLPQVIERHISTRELYKRNEDDFYSSFPALKPYAAQVGQIGVVFRQLNPGLSKEDFIKHVGEYCHTVLGVPKTAAASTPQPLRPHTPIAAGGAPRATPIAADQRNPFEILAGRGGSQGTIPDDEDENP